MKPYQNTDEEFAAFVRKKSHLIRALMDRYIDTHDQEIRDRLFDCCQPLVRLAIVIACDQYRVQMEKQDVLSYAQIGLLEAIERFPFRVREETFENTGDFEPYAMLWIRGCIYRGMMAFRGIKRKQLPYMDGVRFLRVEEHSEFMLSVPDPEDAIAQAELRMNDAYVHEVLMAGIETLSPMRQVIILEHYYGGKSLRQISRELRRSHTWVQQQHEKALLQLKRQMKPVEDLLTG